jgi:DNA polymerase III subunit delta'
MNELAETLLPAPPWTEAVRAALTAAHAQDHLPHALLIHEAPGSGGEWLALWCAQLVLCQERGGAPCGSCRACRRVGVRQHPDLTWIGPEENSRQLRIEQVRNLGEELALTSHAGGYKVGILSPADLLNRFAANALLKTLEEPAARTLLILVVTQPSRLPPTVLSRCQRVRVPAPSRAQSLAWLTAARGPAQWDAALDALGEAPLIAVRSDPQEIAAVGAEARRTLEELTARGADPVAAAERWARSELPLRLQCFEIWLTERIRHRERTGDFMTEMRAGPHLPQGTPVLNIRELFQLVDEVRELRATLDVPLNRGVALESLFRRLAPSLGETHTRL